MTYKYYKQSIQNLIGQIKTVLKSEKEILKEKNKEQKSNLKLENRNYQSAQSGKVSSAWLDFLLYD